MPKKISVWDKENEVWVDRDELVFEVVLADETVRFPRLLLDLDGHFWEVKSWRISSAGVFVVLGIEHCTRFEWKE